MGMRWGNEEWLLNGYRDSFFWSGKNVLNLVVSIAVVVVQSLSYVQLFVTPWTAACLALLLFSTTIQKHHFFSCQPSLLLISYIYLLIFSLLISSITENKISKIPSITVKLYISLISVLACFFYPFETLLLGTFFFNLLLFLNLTFVDSDHLHF